MVWDNSWYIQYCLVCLIEVIIEANLKVVKLIKDEFDSYIKGGEGALTKHDPVLLDALKSV